MQQNRGKAESSLQTPGHDNKRLWIDPFSSLHLKSRRDMIEFLLDSADSLLNECRSRGNCDLTRLRGVFTALLTAGEIYESPRLMVHATVAIDALSCHEAQCIGESTYELIERTITMVRKELI